MKRIPAILSLALCLSGTARLSAQRGTAAPLVALSPLDPRGGTQATAPTAAAWNAYAGTLYYYRVSVMLPATQYQYRVTEFVPTGAAGQTIMVATTPPASDSPIPTVTLSGCTANGCQGLLAWNGFAGAEDYRIESSYGMYYGQLMAGSTATGGASVAGGPLSQLLGVVPKGVHTFTLTPLFPMMRPSPRPRDLSGSALKMQSTTMGIPGQPMQQPQYQQPYGQPQPGTQTTVTVAIPPPSEFARGLTEMLTTVLIRTNRFIVLERAAMQQIEQEQTIGQTKTTKETGAQQGAMLGAQVLIIGDITGFTFNKSNLGGSVTNIIKGLSVAAEKVSAEVIIDLRPDPLLDQGQGEPDRGRRRPGQG